MSTTKCGHTTPCGCADVALTTPAPCTPVGCPDPYPCSEITNAECVMYTGSALLCDNTVVVEQDVNVAVALETLVDYFCNAISGIQVYDIVEGAGINVQENTVGTTTTYTISTETPLLKKFVYEETLPNGNVGQQITIFNTVYTPCGIPTVGCDGTLTAVPTVVDLIIQGYWFNVDENAWLEFTHQDKTGIAIDISGNIGIFPAFDPSPVYLDLPVRIRITIIG